MKLNQLRELVAIVEYGSLRAAARHLGLPQPALTRNIRSLERELGATLFERDTKGMTLTAAGRMFHQRASAISRDVEKAYEEISHFHGHEHGTVSAALSIVSHLQMLPRALPLFRQRYPDVKLQIIEGLFSDVEHRLRDGTLDFYIGAAPHITPAPGLTTQVLRHNTRVVLARKEHPLRKARSLKALASADWATTSIDSNAEAGLGLLFQQNGLPEPRLVLQVRSTMSILVSLAYTDLLALLPVQWKNFPLTRDVLEVIPIKEVIPAPSIVLSRRSDMPLTPAAEYFSDMLLRNIE